MNNKRLFFATFVIIAIVALPSMLDDLFRSANSYYSQGILDQAASLYEKILSLDVDEKFSVDCLCNLGSLSIDLGKPMDGELYYRQALTKQSDHAGALYNLALLLQDDRDHWQESKNLYQKLIVKEPWNREALANLGAVCQQLNEHRESIQAYQSALQLYLPSLHASHENEDKDSIGLIVSTLYENMGRAMLSLGGNTENALESLEQAILYNPSNVVAKHLLKSHRSGDEQTSPTIADPVYVRSLFDSYADNFESSLSSLGYSTPTLLVKHATGGDAFFGLTVDLGCGTGLVGSFLRQANATEWLVGIDLSIGMLAKVEQTKAGIYNHLFVGEQTVFLLALADMRHRRGSYASSTSSSSNVRRKLSGGIIREVDEVINQGFGGAFCGGLFMTTDDETSNNNNPRILVTAADVFVYVGDLQPVMEAFASLAHSGDRFVFSVESLDTTVSTTETAAAATTTNTRVMTTSLPVGVNGEAELTEHLLQQQQQQQSNSRWMLQPSGRFAHSNEYLRDLVKSFPKLVLRSLTSFVPRTDGGKDVLGFLVVVDVV